MKFELGMWDWLAFRRMMTKNPRVFSRASARVINSVAFGVRKLAIRNLHQDGIVRNSRFVETSIRVEKCRLGAPIYAQESIVGSIARPRSTGWEEQETGARDRREYGSTLAGRRNNKRNMLVRGYRMDKAGQFPRPRDFRGGNQRRRVVKMLRTLAKAGFTKPFVIEGFTGRGGFPTGIYKFRKSFNKLSLLQHLEPPKKQPKRTKWLSRAAQQYLKFVNLRTVWGRAVARELKNAGIRV